LTNFIFLKKNLARFTYCNKLYDLIESLLEFEEGKNYLVMESIDFKTSDHFQYIYIISMPEGKEIILVSINFYLKN
jgi:hypothetical protein